MTGTSSTKTPEPQCDVSIIICTRDRCEHLRTMLQHLAGAHVPDDWRVELLIVDNGSSDDTKSVAAQTRLPGIEVRYVFEPRKGKGYAYNTGIAAALGKALLLTDDDVHVPSNWIEEMCRPILSGAADAVQGGIRPAPHLERRWLKGALRIWVACVEDPERPPEGLVGANMAFGRRAIAAAGPFDVRLGPGAAGYYDDTVFGWALDRAGLKTLYLPSVAVEHHFEADRLTVAAFVNAAQKMALSQAIVDRDRDPANYRPSLLSVAGQLPGLGYRCATQLARLVVNREPDAGFLVRYRKFKVWQALRR